MTEVYTVSDLVARIKDRLAGDLRLRDLWARGEVSNLSIPISGHRYFTLKDNGAVISCVLFRNSAANLDFELRNGINVLVFGDVDVYQPQGRLQLIAKGARLDQGMGLRQQELSRLKKRLAEEGLFSEERKRPIPRYPERIGIVTSLQGAALRDVIRTLGDYPAQIVISPAIVQGDGAANSVACAIRALVGRSDLVIVCRGGGSAEDLWPFNTEAVARAIYECKVPVISGIGHETDVTIADHVADLRAATPTAAARLAVPNLDEVRSEFNRREKLMVRAVQSLAEGQRTRLDYLNRSLSHRRMYSLVGDRRQRLDYLADRLEGAGDLRLEESKGRLSALAGRLSAVSPLATLSRGYAIVRTPEGGLVHSAADLEEGEALVLTFADGNVRCRVEGRSNGERGYGNHAGLEG